MFLQLSERFSNVVRRRIWTVFDFTGQHQALISLKNRQGIKARIDSSFRSKEQDGVTTWLKSSCAFISSQENPGFSSSLINLTDLWHFFPSWRCNHAIYLHDSPSEFFVLSAQMAQCTSHLWSVLTMLFSLTETFFHVPFFFTWCMAWIEFGYVFVSYPVSQTGSWSQGRRGSGG